VCVLCGETYVLFLPQNALKHVWKGRRRDWVEGKGRNRGEEEEESGGRLNPH